MAKTGHGHRGGGAQGGALRSAPPLAARDLDRLHPSGAAGGRANGSSTGASRPGVSSTCWPASSSSFATLPTGGEKVIEIVHPGETFAEAGDVPGTRTTVTRRARRRSTRASCSASTAWWCGAFCTSRSRPACAMLASLSRRLHRQVDEVEKLALHPAGCRLAAYLLEQLPSEGPGFAGDPSHGPQARHRVAPRHPARDLLAHGRASGERRTHRRAGPGRGAARRRRVARTRRPLRASLRFRPPSAPYPGCTTRLGLPRPRPAGCRAAPRGRGSRPFTSDTATLCETLRHAHPLPGILGAAQLGREGATASPATFQACSGGARRR